MFQKYILDFEPNYFEELSNSIQFENITEGKLGANIADFQNETIPIVRTTTSYNIPTQSFNTLHMEIIEKIKSISQIPNLAFNNGMVEIYSSTYSKMKFHTDQSLDLEPNSYICIVSFYKNPSNSQKRKLIIQNKITSDIEQIELDHNSVVIFSTDANKTHIHKIILENPNIDSNKWLGITLRQSKSFIKFMNNIPHFASDLSRLRICNSDEKKLFCKLKGIENKEINFNYPHIDFTVSPGDLIKLN